MTYFSPVMVALIAVTIFAGCATTAPEATDVELGENAPAMLGLDARDRAPWTSWTPRDEVAPEDVASRWVVFDRYVVNSRDEVETVWAATFSVLDVVRSRADSDDVRETAYALMALLEPDSETHVELFFVAARRGSTVAEGVLAHVADREGGATSAWVLVGRLEGELQPSLVQIRLLPGYVEPPRVAVDMRRLAGGWSFAMNPGLESDLEATQTPGLVAEIVTTSLWNPYVGSKYDVLAGRDKPDSIPEPLETRRRDIDEVLRDTVFTPRL